MTYVQGQRKDKANSKNQCPAVLGNTSVSALKATTTIRNSARRHNRTHSVVIGQRRGASKNKKQPVKATCCYHMFALFTTGLKRVLEYVLRSVALAGAR